jgi:hypothetical protein
MSRRKLADAGPAADALIAGKLHAAARALLDARAIATEAKRADDQRDIGVVLATLATAARRVDNREQRSRVVLQFKAPAAVPDD